MPIQSSRTLPHNVIDAEYSKALDAIVMVSSAPSALYIYDVATGLERSLALRAVPTAVSVSPNGLSADVGHSDSVSHVDLTTVGSPGADAVGPYLVERPVGDLVSDGFGWTHVFAAADQWVGLYSINTGSGSTKRGDFSVYEGMQARLNPTGNAIYGVTTALSPSDIYRFTDSQGTITDSRDSPYHGEYQMCNNLWFSANGRRIYTACGNTFRASDFRSQDMTYMGAIPLLNVDFYGPRILSLDDSAEAGEIALIEGIQRAEDCGVFYQTCPSRLGLYESQFVNAIASYSIPDAVIDGTARHQLAQHVFHSRDGATKYLITWLYPGSTYQLLTVP